MATLPTQLGTECAPSDSCTAGVKLELPETITAGTVTQSLLRSAIDETLLHNAIKHEATAAPPQPGSKEAAAVELSTQREQKGVMCAPDIKVEHVIDVSSESDVELHRATPTASATGPQPLHTPWCPQQRGVFMNPRNVTCYLGSLNQSLLHVHGIRAVLRQHPWCESSQQDRCPLCLLKHSMEQTDVPGQRIHLECWKTWITSIPAPNLAHGNMRIDWNAQQDPMEILQVMLRDTRVDSLLQRIVFVGGVKNLHVNFPCGHAPAIDRQIPWCGNVFELVCPADINRSPGEQHKACLSLLDVINMNTGTTGNHEWEACRTCGAMPQCCESHTGLYGGDVMIFAINRRVIDWARQRHKKVRTPVCPDDLIPCGNSAWELCCVVEHLGDNVDSGHYVCHVRVRAEGWITYNDALVSHQHTLPSSVWTNTRLVVYEKHVVSSIVEPEVGIQQPAVPSCAVAGHIPSSVKPAAPSLSDLPTSEATLVSQFVCEPQVAFVAQNSNAAPGSLEDDTMKGVDKLMDSPAAEDRLEQDARALITHYLEHKDVHAFLQQLPDFVQESHTDAVTMHTCNLFLEASIRDLITETVNSSAALQTCQYIGDTVYYPLIVLGYACMIAHGTPLTFFVDIVYTIVGSLFHKELHVKMNAYVSKSRHWTSMIAGTGQSKSPNTKMFMEILFEVLDELSAVAPGRKGDEFHTCQSTTTAAVIAKIRETLGYLLLYSDDAGNCVSLPFASGGKTDKGEHVDLTYFLNAAHGDEFSHQTCRDRDQQFKKRNIVNPDDSVPVETSLCLKPTNVHVMWLLQELYFAKYWARLAFTKPIGLAQRNLFSFGVRKKEKNIRLFNFFLHVGKPLFKKLFTSVLQLFGPKAPLTDMTFKFTSEQEAIAADIEETLLLFAQKKHVGRTLADAMPKAFYWFGTSLLSTQIICSLFKQILLKNTVIKPVMVIEDGVFLAGVQFIHKRYLYGQAVLSCAVSEEAWDGIDVEPQDNRGEAHDCLVTVLRHHAGAIIDERALLQSSLEDARTMSLGSQLNKALVKEKHQAVLQNMVDLGFGIAIVDTAGHCTAVHKFHRSSLVSSARGWLRTERIAIAQFGATSLTSQQHNVSPEHNLLAPTEAMSSDTAQHASADCAQRPDTPKPSSGIHSCNASHAEVEKTHPPHEVFQSKTLFMERVGVSVMGLDELAQHLKQRPEWSKLRVTFPKLREQARWYRGEVKCTHSLACKAWWEVKYFRRWSSGLPPTTLLIRFIGEHNHAGTTSNTRLFSGDALNIANSYVAHMMARRGCMSVEGLQEWLTSRAVPPTDLPSNPQLHEWLKRARITWKHSKDQYAMQPGSHNLTDIVSRNLEQRQHQLADMPLTGLCILPANDRYPTREISAQRVCVIFLSKGMFDTLRRFVGTRVHITVDTKMKVLLHQRGVCTAFIHTKAGLSKTTFHQRHLKCDLAEASPKKPGRDRQIQGKAHTTQHKPVLQEALDEESGPNHEALLLALADLWQASHPDGPRWDAVFDQLHSDFAPGIESARRRVCPWVRPVKDFFHFIHKESEMQSRCRETTLSTK